MVRLMTVILLLILTVAAFTLPSFAARMSIDPGRGIGPALIGMRAGPARAALAKFGGRLSQASQGNVQVIGSASEGLTVWIQGGVVRRVRTVNPAHRTVTGLAPGTRFGVIARESFCNKDGVRASVEFERDDSSHIGCPFMGLIVEVADGVVAAVSVIPACAPFDKQHGCPWRPGFSPSPARP
jgi:hypothetical protein